MKINYAVLFTVFVIFLFFTGCPDITEDSEFYSNFKQHDKVNWVWMVYMGADNNLDSYSLLDINEMESGLYNLQKNNPSAFRSIKIITFTDRSTNTDLNSGWSNTRVYEIVPDNNSGSVKSSIIANYRDQDSADPDNLKKFLNNVYKYYPANNYMLTIWSHGDGVRNIINTDYLASAVIDDTSGNQIYLDMFQQAIKSSSFNNTGKLKIIGFDTCYMGMVEIAYEFRDVADYFIGSMDTEPGGGWNYSLILNDLSADTIDGGDFAVKVVDEYYKYYQTSSSTVTLTAVDLSRIEDIKDALFSLADQLSRDVTDCSYFEKQVRDNSRYFFSSSTHSKSNPAYEIYSFCMNISSRYSSILTLVDKADAVRVQLGSAIIAACSNKESVYNLKGADADRGLSIFISRGELGHYSEQVWYSSRYTSLYGYKYGGIDFAVADSSDDADGKVTTWKELFEYWYDTDNTLTTMDHY